MHDPWTERLSEYLDGELGAVERDALERHLDACDECRRTLAELEQVIAAAVAAPLTAPATDLWSGIAQRIGAPAPAPVIALAERHTVRRRVSFTFPQLAAAATVLMLLGAGGVYVGLRQLEPAAGPQAQASTQTSAPVAPVQLVGTAYAVQESAISELEDALAQNRTRLDTATVRVVEQSLSTIDRAIADASVALAQDPANPYLHRHLDGAMKKKIDILRRAVSVRRAAS